MLRYRERPNKEFRPFAFEYNRAQNISKFRTGQTIVWTKIILVNRDYQPITIRYFMLPYSSDNKNSISQFKRRRTNQIEYAIESSFKDQLIIKEGLPKIHCNVCVTSSDGGTRSAAINSLTQNLLRFKDSLVGLKGLPLSSTFGKVNGEIVNDPNYLEDSKGQLDCCVAFLIPFKEIVWLQSEGQILESQFIEQLEIAFEHCNCQIYNSLKETISR